MHLVGFPFDSEESRDAYNDKGITRGVNTKFLPKKRSMMSMDRQEGSGRAMGDLTAFYQPRGLLCSCAIVADFLHCACCCYTMFVWNACVWPTRKPEIKRPPVYVP